MTILDEASKHRKKKGKDNEEEIIDFEEIEEIEEDQDIEKAIEEVKKDEKKLKITKKAKPKPKKKSKGIGKIIALVGEQGTGKTYSAQTFQKFGKILYLDTEGEKAEISKIEHFPESKNIEIIPVLKYFPNSYKPNYLQTIDFIRKETSKWVQKLKSGQYKTCVIDSLDAFKTYAKYDWFRAHPKRTKIQRFEYGDIEETIQQLVLPFLYCCRKNNVFLILIFETVDHYINDIVVGTKEAMKLWLLKLLDIELWYARDFRLYALKHYYKPYWEIDFEGLDLADWILDKEFIDEYADFKEYNDFKEETLMSKGRYTEIKEKRKKLELELK